MEARFGKKEKLKSKKEIDLLFTAGTPITQYPIRLIYHTKTIPSHCTTVAVSVGKRNFKKAVQRNHIKRLLRESYRKNKYIVQSDTTPNFNFMFLYIGKEIPDQSLITAKMKKLLQKFMSKECAAN